MRISDWSSDVCSSDLLNAMSFSVAGLAAIVLWLARGENPLRHLRQPPLAWALGVAGLLGYHALYFLALKLAPPLEARLINRSEERRVGKERVRTCRSRVSHVT